MNFVRQCRSSNRSIFNIEYDILRLIDFDEINVDFAAKKSLKEDVLKFEIKWLFSVAYIESFLLLVWFKNAVCNVCLTYSLNF